MCSIRSLSPPDDEQIAERLAGLTSKADMGATVRFRRTSTADDGPNAR